MAALTDVGAVALIGGVLIYGGVSSIKTAFRRRKQKNLVSETPTEDVESVSMGQSEVKGTARPGPNGTIPAPFTGDDCLIAEWSIHQYYVTEDDDGHDQGDWREVASGTAQVPFYVDDGTGKLLVRPDDDVVLEIDDDDAITVEVAATESPDDRILEFEQSQGIDRPHPGEHHGDNREGDRRYHERRFVAGKDAYVFGVVQRREDQDPTAENEKNAVIERVPEGDEDLEDMFMIADKPEEEIVEDRKYAMLYFPFGALVATAGFGLLILAVAMLLGIQVL